MQRIYLSISALFHSPSFFLRGFGLALLLLLLGSRTPRDAAAQGRCGEAAGLFSQQTASNADCAAAPAGSTLSAATMPSKFQESIVFSNGLVHPTTVRFASDGRVFVAQKSGVIQVFASLTATTPITFADLSTEVDDYWDRGLLGLALDPNFPTDPYVYVLYTFDAPIGGTAPTWGDACPTPPGPTTDGCMVSGRLSRLTADSTGNTMLSEQVLINDWCQQFPSHSMGTLLFGPDGALYVSAGEGASFSGIDYGQYGGTYAGDQVNPCGDPPTAAGTPPPNNGTAEGGSLRSQSLNRAAGDPVVLNGAILRVDPTTGEALPTNPLFGSSDANGRRIIGYGLRNPFRLTFRPGTSEIWVGDVGQNAWEEVDRIISPTAAPINNFGWPCYEGNNSDSAVQPGFQSANLNICGNLYATPGSVTAPYYAYQHGVPVVPGEDCQTATGAAITGLAFYNGGSYPGKYNGALFFADNSRHCIWVMFAGTDGLPDKTKIANFVTNAANPVDLEIGPGGDLFYVDFAGGTIRRIQYVGPADQPPVAVITADPTNGVAPLAVSFDGTGSYDPDPGDSITAFSWDLNGDGVYGDAITSTASYTYTIPGTYTVSLMVTDQDGVTGASSVVINAQNTAPTAVIDSPAQEACASTSPCWAVGDTINFSGHATDLQDGALPASRLAWTVILHHCPIDINSCHTHDIQTFSGISNGSFSAPDHSYPAYLEIKLTATDAGDLQDTTSVFLYPKTVSFTLQSSLPGLLLNINGNSVTTPFVYTVIVNSNNSISAPSPQDLNGLQYAFKSWSDNGDQTHNLVVGAQDMKDKAKYTLISADVGITQTEISSAGHVTYTLQVENYGPASAQGVVVTDTLPSNGQFVSASTTQGTCTGGSTVTCAIGAMNKSPVVTVTIGVNVAMAAGLISNAATVSASVNSPDPSTTNNASLLNAYVLSVGPAGPGNGIISSAPFGIDCGGTCRQIFAEGTVVTLSAKPVAGSMFDRWSGACAGQGACTVTMTQARAATATFSLKSYVVTVVITGTGGGVVTSTPVGITCGVACQESFTHATPLTLTAVPAAGSTFVGWSGGCASAGACKLVVLQGVTLTAMFNQPPPQFKVYLPLVTQGAAPAGFPPARQARASSRAVAVFRGGGRASAAFARAADDLTQQRLNRQPMPVAQVPAGGTGRRVGVVASMALLYEGDAGVQRRGQVTALLGVTSALDT